MTSKGSSSRSKIDTMLNLVNKGFRRLRKKYREIRGQLFFETGDYRETVILAGSGRSGTTWVQEIINSKNDYRVMFEPFHSLKIGLLNNWNYRQYLQPSDDREEFIRPAARILSGQIRHKWIDKYNRKTFPHKRLIKDIRIQLLLPWIKHNFPEIPIIMLLRHPCAVATSRFVLGWDSHLDDFLSQPELVNDFLHPFKKALENVEDPFEKQIFMWCVENYIPLKQFNENDILVVFYEHLFRDPQNGFKRIMRFIGSSYSPDMLNRIRKPSTESRKDTAVVTGSDPVSAWRENVSDEQVKKAVEILQIFGLDQIYNETVLPLVNESEALEII